MGEFYRKSAKQEKNCSETSGWECLGVGIVQVGQEEKHTSEGPQERKTVGLGTRDFKTGQPGGSGREPGTSDLPLKKRWLSDNQDHRAALHTAGGQLGKGGGH